VVTDAQRAANERGWLLRALLVLQSPRPVFAALRDDSEEAARARAEPIIALVWLAGIAGVLATPVAGRVLDDPAFDGLLIGVWAFLGGGLFGTAVYFGAGGVLQLAGRALGTRGSYRRARHVLAFSAAPLALALVLYWPIRIAIQGGDVFRTGGADGGHVLADVFYIFVAWALALLVVGVRTVHGWSWPRATATLVLAAVAGAALLALGTLLGL
jgi:Yip1 domain